MLIISMMERDVQGVQPRGRKRIAHRFIGGGKNGKDLKPRRGEREFEEHFCRPWRDSLGASTPDPTAEALGYSLSPSGLKDFGLILPNYNRSLGRTRRIGSIGHRGNRWSSVGIL